MYSTYYQAYSDKLSYQYPLLMVGVLIFEMKVIIDDIFD